MKTVLALILAALAVLPALSAEPAKRSASDSLISWFKNWKQGLEKSAVESRYRKARTTSVAAVRGAGQESDSKKPYWKGGRNDKLSASRMAERKELEAAVNLIMEQKYDDADAKLAAFEKDHPKSAFLSEAQEARGKLAELKSQPAEAPAQPEAPAEAAPAKEEAKP